MAPTAAAVEEASSTYCGKGWRAAYVEAFESQEAIFADLRCRLEAARLEGERLTLAISDSESEWSEDEAVVQAPSLAELNGLLDAYDGHVSEEDGVAPTTAELHQLLERSVKMTRRRRRQSKPVLVPLKDGRTPLEAIHRQIALRRRRAGASRGGPDDDDDPDRGGGPEQSNWCA